jgi:hypothetical protein
MKVEGFMFKAEGWQSEACGGYRSLRSSLSIQSKLTDPVAAWQVNWMLENWNKGGECLSPTR